MSYQNKIRFSSELHNFLEIIYLKFHHRLECSIACCQTFSIIQVDQYLSFVFGYNSLSFLFFLNSNPFHLYHLSSFIVIMIIIIVFIMTFIINILFIFSFVILSHFIIEVISYKYNSMFYQIVEMNFNRKTIKNQNIYFILI